MKDTKSLLLALLSAGLIGTWVYHFYDKASYTNLRADAAPAADSTALAEAVRDSMELIYSEVINQLDSQLDSSQSTAADLKLRLENRLREINQLRSEITRILGKRDFSKSDLALARIKIAELQKKVDELTGQKQEMEDEKIHLTQVLDRLTNYIDSLEMNMRRLSIENESLFEKVNQASVFIAYDVKIDAIQVKGSSEESTSQARKTNKFVASFILQNRMQQFINTEVTTVLVQPDGQVYQSTVWDSGTFESRNEGKKNFTRKIKFDYERGEQKNILFTIDAENCQKGMYKFQVWHKGVLIGQALKKLG